MAEASGWDADEARVVAAAACRVVGLPGDGLTLVRIAKNAVFAVAGRETVVRVCRPSHSDRLAMRTAIAARSCGIPILAPEIATEPVQVDGHDVSFWPRCSPAGDDIDWAWFGATLRALHDRTDDLASAAGRPPDLLIDELPSLRARLASMSAASVSPERGDGLGALLGERMAQLSQAIETVEWSSPVLVHGDAHPGNVLRTHDGRPVIGDLDHVAMGPASWDQVPVDVETRHFGRPRDDLMGLRTGYGRDCSPDPGYELLVRLRELKVTTWLAGVAGDSPAIGQELRTRLSYWRGDTDERWTYV